jgi:hypothetical protein
MAPELLELVDHTAGTEITIAGKKLVRVANGECRGKANERPWWKSLEKFKLGYYLRGR